MRVFKKILCPVDFSDYSKLAFRYAWALAQENRASLVVCHSVPDLSQALNYTEGNYMETVHEALLANAREKLDSFLGDRSEVIQIVEKGNPGDLILQTRKRTGADLIVMGTHGHSGYERYFMGSVTNKVLHKTTVPVLTVSHQTRHFVHEDQPRMVEIKRILCGLDYEESSRHIAKLSLQIAQMYGAEVIFFHSVPSADTTDWLDQKEWVKNKLLQFIDLPDEEACSTEFLVVAGDPVKWIKEIVRGNEMDLVVLGHHTRPAIEEMVLGSVAKRVLTSASCPVLVARSPMDLRGTRSNGNLHFK